MWTYLMCNIKENVFYLQYTVLIIIYKDIHIYSFITEMCNLNANR